MITEQLKKGLSSLSRTENSVFKVDHVRGEIYNEFLDVCGTLLKSGWRCTGSTFLCVSLAKKKCRQPIEATLMSFVWTDLIHNLPFPDFSFTISQRPLLPSPSGPGSNASIKLCLPSRVPSASRIHSPIHPSPGCEALCTGRTEEWPAYGSRASHMYFFTIAYPRGECGLQTRVGKCARDICTWESGNGWFCCLLRCGSGTWGKDGSDKIYVGLVAAGRIWEKYQGDGRVMELSRGGGEGGMKCTKQ